MIYLYKLVAKGWRLGRRRKKILLALPQALSLKFRFIVRNWF